MTTKQSLSVLLNELGTVELGAIARTGRRGDRHVHSLTEDGSWGAPEGPPGNLKFMDPPARENTGDPLPTE